MFRLTMLFCAVAALFLSSCRPPSEAPVITGESHRTFTPDGAWCWFSDPRAVHYKGAFNRVYTGWVDSTGSVWVGVYDHDSKMVGASMLHKTLQKDDHNNPALFMDESGRLTVFYAKHATRDPMYMMQAKEPENILEWEAVRVLDLNDTVAYAGLSDTYTYANIHGLKNENNRMFLFWRGSDFKPNYSVSDDLGDSWTNGKIFILPERSYPNRRPYYKIASSDDAIHFAFTDGHPNAEPTNSIYYMKYRGGVLYKANGEKITDWPSLPLEPRQADVVYDALSTNEKAWIWDIAEGKDGNPVIVYARFPNDSIHEYYYSSWKNGKWNENKIVSSGKWFPRTPAGKEETEKNYSGGIALDPNNPWNVYLSRNIGGKFEIERWSTSNGGESWTVTPITKNSMYDNVRPFVVRNAAPSDSVALLWMNVQKYVHWTDYRATIKIHVTD